MVLLIASAKVARDHGLTWFKWFRGWG